MLNSHNHSRENFWGITWKVYRNDNISRQKDLWSRKRYRKKGFPNWRYALHRNIQTESWNWRHQSIWNARYLKSAHFQSTVHFWDPSLPSIWLEHRNIIEISVCSHYPNLKQNSENLIKYANQYMQDPQGFHIDRLAWDRIQRGSSRLLDWVNQ